MVTSNPSDAVLLAMNTVVFLLEIEKYGKPRTTINRDI